MQILSKDFYTKDTNLQAILLLLLPMHVFGIAAFGHLNLTTVLAALVGYVLISGYGVAVAYHRFLSHKAFQTYTWVKAIIVYLGALACQGSPLFWVAVHRGYHHPFSDTEKDMHSPSKGLFHAYIGWILFLKPKELKMRGAVDLARDPVVMFIHNHYYALVWATWAIAWCIDPNIFCGLALAQLWAFHQENLVDVLGHTRIPGLSYRNFETRDKSVNSPLGYVSWGQAWHNNHHADPGAYNFGKKWWELDPSAALVWLIKKRA